MSTSFPVSRPRLTAALLVRDEQEVLAGSIESVRHVADEILVLDTGSVDRTVTVARRLGAKVCQMPWDDDFSAARNRLLDEAAGDWVLWLDAGERLAAESAEELREFVLHRARPSMAYRLIIEQPAAEANGSSEQAARIRLMPRRPELRFTGRVCESIRPALDAQGYTLDTAPGLILAHPRCHSAEVKAQRARRNLRLIGRETADRGEVSLRLLLLLGEATADLGDAATAREAFRRVADAAPPGSLEKLEAYYGLVAASGNDANQRNLPIGLCLEALEWFPLDAQLLLAMGGCLQAQGRLDLAARAFESAADHGCVNPETWHLREVCELASSCLAAALQLLGQGDEARQKLEESLARHPHSPRLRRHLIELYLKQGRLEDAQGLAEAPGEAAATAAAFGDAVRGACEATRKNWTAALAHLQAAYAAGCHDPLCLRWLTVTLWTHGQMTAARPVVQEWLRAEPNHGEALRYWDAILQASIAPAAAEERSDPHPSHSFRVDGGSPLVPPLRPIIAPTPSTLAGPAAEAAAY